VVGAGLFLRTFASLNQLPLGFVPQDLVVSELNLQAGGGPPEGRFERVVRLRDAVAAVPGVRSASVAAQRILDDGGWSGGGVAIDDGPSVSIGRPGLWLNATTPGWFDTMRIPLRSGRDFDADDRLGTGYVAIVNEAFVRRLMPGVQPIGHRVRMDRSDLHGFAADARFEIIGVAADAIYTVPRDGMRPTMYVAMAQRNPGMFWESVALTMRAAPDRRAMVEREAAGALSKADPAIAFSFRTFDALVQATVTQERLIALLSAFFGALALLLAALGLYGLVTHSVRARRMEIGLRMALGAAASSIVRLVFRRVGVLIAAGLVLGLAGSLWAAKFVGTLLFQLEARDPMTFAGGAAVLVAVGAAAAWLPARRAARVDPLEALRND
jgi:predicted permease